MTTIDTSTWGEFVVTDLFEHIERGKGSGAGSFMNGAVPYIAASFANNGYVRGVADADGSLTSDGNCIAMIVNGNGGIGRNTYQADPFVGSSDLQLGYHPRLNVYTGLFLVACLNKSIERYGYNFQWKRTGNAFAQETVFLPVTIDGQPDWNYMQSVMERQIAEQEERLNSLLGISSSPVRKVDSSNWANFQIQDLFTIERAKRRTINSYAKGGVPYVTNSAFNNGVTDYLQPKSKDDIEKGRCITINTVDGSVFWQPHDFLANSSGNGLIILRRENLEETAALFLCSIIEAHLDPTFQMMLTTDDIRNLTLPLPATVDGAPDWVFMTTKMEKELLAAEAKIAMLHRVMTDVRIEEEG
ncbi:restriction endonuclease subunit S [Trueperella pyogenes]|uniref:restriction endonuclease subunit S n=1 Tax=Trueperella pyogenes TaxID=1661 RepID=UPI0006B257D7|nr:restriction endonuclease subunit S [Trueperella pyogenes]ALD74011.1 hypothetical protein AN946_06430 [Trueperella pyogenes]